MKPDKAATDEKFASNRSQQERQDPHWTQVQGVTIDASSDEIREAYQKKISMDHPDKVSGLGIEFNGIAERKSKEINAAYDEAMRLKN